MPPLPVIDGIHRVAISWRNGVGGPTAVNVMHFKGASSDPDGLRTALNTNVTNQMWPGMISGAAAYLLTITPLDNTSATRTYTPSGAGWAGGVSGGDWSPASAGLVSFRTAVRGRQNRGRLFIPFLSELSIASGSYTISLVSAQSAWDAFRAAMTTSSFPLHIASYGHGYHKSGGKGSPIIYTPVTWTPHSNQVTASTVETSLGTMRPRQSRLR